MGCHTWYRKPLVKGKENIQKYLKDQLEDWKQKDWWTNKSESEDFAFKYLEAIENLDENMNEELLDYLTANDTLCFIKGEPVIFVKYENDTDEPRIGGYPDTIITSAEQMFEVMKTGLTGFEGKHFNFRIEKGRKKYIENHINTFFEKYPDGIIEFG
jgi:hypothetical protein